MWFVLSWDAKNQRMIIHNLCSSEKEARQYVSEKELQKYLIISTEEMDNGEKELMM